MVQSAAPGGRAAWAGTNDTNPAAMIRISFLSMLVAVLSGCVTTEPPQLPISVEVSQTGSRLLEWRLSVSQAGLAKLTVWKFTPNPEQRERTREFLVSQEQFRQLAAVLARESFFALKSEYGELVPDSGRRTITVRQGGRERTVTLHFLMNWVFSEPWKLGGSARALRVFNEVRSWIEDDDVPDMKEYDARVFQAAGRRT